MTFRSIELELPNGFHDILITEIAFDAIRHTVSLQLSVDISDDPEPTYRSIKLLATGVSLFFLEPPKATYPYRFEDGGMQASGDDNLQGISPELEQLVSQQPPGNECYRFFLYNWNSFLYVASRHASYDWCEQ